MVLTRINNTPVPFGATVSSLTKPDNHSSFVGDAGQTWLTGLGKQGRLLVKWGTTAADQCQVTWRMPNTLRFWCRNLTRAMSVSLLE